MFVCLLLALQSLRENKEQKDPARDPQYNEPLIDSMRAQKDQVSAVGPPAIANYSMGPYAVLIRGIQKMIRFGQVKM